VLYQTPSDQLLMLTNTSHDCRTRLIPHMSAFY
jgi:hypothetical protein